MVLAHSSPSHHSSTRSSISSLCFSSFFGRGGGRDVITSYHHCRIWGLLPAILIFLISNFNGKLWNHINPAKNSPRNPDTNGPLPTHTYHRKLTRTTLPGQPPLFWWSARSSSPTHYTTSPKCPCHSTERLESRRRWHACLPPEQTQTSAKRPSQIKNEKKEGQITRQRCIAFMEMTEYVQDTKSWFYVELSPKIQKQSR